MEKPLSDRGFFISNLICRSCCGKYIKGRLKSISDDLLMCLNGLAGELFGNQFFQRREVIARAQYQAAQDFGRRGFVGKEFE